MLIFLYTITLLIKPKYKKPHKAITKGLKDIHQSEKKQWEMPFLTLNQVRDMTFILSDTQAYKSILLTIIII